ncbi:MAG: mechanosensitive ion channel domain-containing protein [Ginsengibacter sp.]
MKLNSLLYLLIFSCITVSAQVKDTAQSPKRHSEYSLFANDDTLTRNDYLLSIEKIFQTLNKASVLSQPVPAIMEMGQRVNEDDSAIHIIKVAMNNNDRGLNVRNLQMFSIILKQINKNSKDFAWKLHQYDSSLDAIKQQIFNLRQDTVIRRIFRDSALRASFSPELLQLRTKWKKTDSLVKKVNVLIDNTLALTSNNVIASNESLLQAENLMTTTGSGIFKKERRYLWESRKGSVAPPIRAQFQNTLATERKITNYYFSHTHNQLVSLLLTGLVFFFWVRFNFSSLKKRNKIDTLQPFHFQYINAVPVFATLVFILNLAPLFDLDAPYIFIATVGFLLMITLTVSFWKRLPGKVFYFWIIFVLLFLIQIFSRYLGLPFYMNRWLLFVLNSLSVLLGVYAVLVYKKKYQQFPFIGWTAGLYALLNLFSVVCNLFGRVTLMQLFGSTATYAFIQTAGLFLFVQLVTEAFLLQIQSSRIRKDYPENFDSTDIKRGVSRLVVFWAIVIWLIVFATNLNIYNFVFDGISQILSSTRSIGSFSFTFGGILLFLAIMWTANFLQKYIAYFFGDIGDDAIFNNKAQRSRLMVTRLVLLVAGFLIAVSASGLAIDRITVILGALSVGIGLGLQGIVNNFVSGIILIFDRTLRIGDTVEIGDKKGRVKEISMRSSTLLTSEGAEVIIPNGDILSHNFVNWSLSDNYIRVELTFNVDHLIDPDDMHTSLMAIIKSSSDVLAQKEPEVFVNTITSQSTQLKIYFWCNEVTKKEKARSEVYSAIYQHLEEKGVKIL